MKFLRSIIADARPRKPMLEPSNSSSSPNGWKTHEYGGNDPGSDEKPSAAVDQTRPSSLSLPDRDKTSEIILGNTPAASSTDNLANQDGLGMETNVEPESPLSVTMDMGRPNPDEESYSHIDIGNLLDRESTPEADKLPKVEESLTPQPVSTVIQDGRTNPPTSQDHDFLIASPETHSPQDPASGNEKTEPVSSSTSIEETPAIQTSSTQTTNSNSSESSRRVESGVLGPYLVPATLSPGASGNPRPDGVVAATSQGTGTDGDLQQPGESPVDNALGPLHGHAPTPASPISRNEGEKTTTDGGKAGDDSPGDDKQVDMKGLPNPGNVPPFPKPDEAKGTARDVQLVSQHANPVAPPATKDIEHAPIPQSAGNKDQVPACSPTPAANNPPPGLEQPVAGSARNSARAEALRSVPARPLQTNPIPKPGDGFRSRPSLKPPENKHQAPKVQIGQIDVIIETATQSAPKPASIPATTDLASRHYLRRL